MKKLGIVSTNIQDIQFEETGTFKDRFEKLKNSYTDKPLTEDSFRRFEFELHNLLISCGLEDLRVDVVKGENGFRIHPNRKIDKYALLGLMAEVGEE